MLLIVAGFLALTSAVLAASTGGTVLAVVPSSVANVAGTNVGR
jgi:hypothetical protein